MLGWFRRHAKILMVVLGSAAMAIFGLGPVFDELARRGGNAESLESQVVATWDGGKVTRNDLEKLQLGHYQAQRFLSGLRETAEAKKGDRIRSLAIPLQGLGDTQNKDMVDDRLIGKFLLSERAKAEGVLVSDGMVDDYILLSAGDVEFSNRDLDEINRAANQNCSLQKVKEHLKFELLAMQMQQYASAGIPIVPNPTEAIELYSRSQERVECEVLPVNVDEFVAKLGDDDIPASELKKIYDQGKFDFPDPTGKEPGFKVGPKLNVQYLKASYEVALTNEMNKLTDAEVQAEYDRLVAEKNPLVMEEVKIEDDSISIDTSTPDSDVVLPGESEAAEAPADVTPPPSGAAVPAVETPVESAPVETPVVESAPAVETPSVPAVEVPAVEVPAVETPAVPAVEIPAVEVPAQSGSAVPATEGSFKVSKSKFQFVSTVATQDTPVVDAAQQVVEKVVEAQAPAVVEAPVVDSALGEGSTQAPVATPPVESVPVETPVVETPVVEAPPVQTPAIVETPSAPEVDTTSIAPATTSDAPLVTMPPPGQDDEEDLGGLGGIEDSVSDLDAEEAEAVDTRKPKPLVEVADEVKRSMCQVAARKAMDDSLKKASALVEDHFIKMMRWEEYDNKKGDPPAPLDFKEMATKYGLVFTETGLVDDVEIHDDPLGKLGMPVTNRANGRRSILPVGQMLFNNFANLRAFEHQTVNDLWGSQDAYLFWVEEKANTRVPEFDECKDEVKKFLMQKKAFDLAMAEAEAMKKKVNDIRGKTLGEVFGESAVPTGAFSWFNNLGSARYGVPSGVKAAGEDFMKTAFSLAKLEAGVAANASKDVIYVIQATEPSRAMSEAGHDFLANQYFKYKRIPSETLQVSQRYVQELSLEFNQELHDELGFKFIDR